MKTLLVALAALAAGCSARTTRVHVRVAHTPLTASAEADVVVEVPPPAAGEPAARLVLRLEH
jgi:hypothetical protein